MRLSLCALLALLATAACAQAYSVLEDVPYDSLEGVDQNLLSLDVYRPVGDGPFPVVVFVHGGGWYLGDKRSTVHAKAGWLTGRGVLLVSVNYRLSPTPTSRPSPDRITFPTHPSDVGRALDFVRANAASWGGDASRLVLMGHSAGAHLASLVGVDGRYSTGEAPACVVSLDTNAYNIPAYLASGPSALQRAIYVNAFTSDPDVQVAASPVTHLGTASRPSFLIVHQEQPDRTATADGFLDALRLAGLEADRVTTTLEHDEINRLLGSDAAPALTTAVEDVLDGCFGVATATSDGPDRGDVRVSPNPSDGRIRLALPSGGTLSRIRVVDAQGRTVVRTRARGRVHDLDVSHLAPGTYLVVVRGRGRVTSERITVAR